MTLRVEESHECARVMLSIEVSKVGVARSKAFCSCCKADGMGIRRRWAYNSKRARRAVGCKTGAGDEDDTVEAALRIAVHFSVPRAFRTSSSIIRSDSSSSDAFLTL